MHKLCVTCRQEIPLVRLAALPAAVQCLPCVKKNGDEPPLKGTMVWHHKTAPELEIGTRLAAAGGRSNRYGPSIQLDAR